MFKGEFLINEVVTDDVFGKMLVGTVVSGSLRPGMEAIIDGEIIVIGELLTRERENREVAVAREDAMLVPDGVSEALAGLLAGQTLEFTEARSVPAKAGLLLTPDLT